MPSFPLKKRRGVGPQFTGIYLSSMSRNSRIWIMSTFHNVTLEKFSSNSIFSSLSHTSLSSSPLLVTPRSTTPLFITTIQSPPHCTTKVDTLTMKSQFFAVLATLLSLCTATPLVEKYSSNCINFTISTPISAYCAPASQIPTSISFQTLTAFIDALGEIVFSDLVTGTYTTAATYCEPQVYNLSRANTLQFLVHGASYTKGCKYHVQKS
jgi:hypothetical protein